MASDEKIDSLQVELRIASIRASMFQFLGQRDAELRAAVDRALSAANVPDLLAVAIAKRLRLEVEYAVDDVFRRPEVRERMVEVLAPTVAQAVAERLGKGGR